MGAARSTRARARYTLRRATAGVGTAVVLWYSLACARSSVVNIRYSVTVRVGSISKYVQIRSSRVPMEQYTSVCGVASRRCSGSLQAIDLPCLPLPLEGQFNGSVHSSQFSVRSYPFTAHSSHRECAKDGRQGLIVPYRHNAAHRAAARERVWQWQPNELLRGHVERRAAETALRELRAAAKGLCL